MADDINIDPALVHPPSSVVSDLTPLASPALSPFPPSRPPSRLNGLVSRHGSPDIAVPATHVHPANATSNGNAAGSNGTDVPVPQQSTSAAAASHPSAIPKQPSTAGVKRKVDDSSIMRCPYRESRKCRKEYKHKNAMRYHLEQAHAHESDVQQRLAEFPAQPASKKAKTASNKASHVTGASTYNKSTSQRSSAQPSPSAPPAPNPFFGLFTHGYVFSSTGVPFRPLNRPIDALYYLNILSTAGIKSQQQRASERLMINALLNADFVRHLQDNVNGNSNTLIHPSAHHHQLDLFDEKGMLKPPIFPIQPSTSLNYGPYSKRDADSAILKLAKTLQDVGLGDGIDNAQYF